MKVIKALNRDVIYLIRSPLFIYLTIIGNTIILLFSCTFWYLERFQNPKLLSFIDALWWSFATATTVGYGDITPITTLGKILGIMLMLTGTALFASYTALFAKAILDNEVIKLERIEEKADNEIVKLKQSIEKLVNKLEHIEKKLP